MTKERVAPHRHIEARIEVGADSWEEFADRLRDLAQEIDMGKWRGPGGFSSGWASSFTYEVEVDDAVDGDSYRDAVTRYVEVVE